VKPAPHEVPPARRQGARPAGLMARAEKKGFSPSAMDTLIAAIAVDNGMVVATLNKKDFERLGVEIVAF
jgi:predicted nucleic acid-binding protein